MGHEVSLKKKIRRALLDKILSINVCFRVMEKVKFTDQTEGKDLFSLHGMCTKSFQSCPTLCNPMDHSPPGSSVHRIL